jgi:predicted double-glycine peptidase
MEGRKTIRLIVGVVFFFLVASGYSSSVLAGSLDVRIGNMSFSKDVKTLKDMRFNNIVRQSLDYSCGAASLATIITYYFGRETTEEEVMKGILMNADSETLARVKEKGFSLLDLKNFGESLGYKGAGYRVPAHQLETLDRPAIVLINHKGYAHFVVLKGVKDIQVFIADPVRGNTVMDLNKFLEIWNGILLVFKNPYGERIESHALNVRPNRVKGNINALTGRVNLGFVRGPSEFK